MKLLFLFILLSVIFAACKDDEDTSTKETYVLVHGAWMGEWAWDNVKPILEQQGHTVVTVDLNGLTSLEAYTQKTLQAINAQNKPVILVGHSMGGIVISQANEVATDKIKKLVYLSAYLLHNGESLYNKSLEPTHESSLIGQNWVQTSADVASINPDGIKEVFCADCTDAQVNVIKTKTTAQPIAPLGTPVSVNTDVNKYKEKRYYIETTLDNAVPNAVQKQMYTALPCKQVFSLQTSHSPFLSEPNQLADLLIKLKD